MIRKLTKEDKENIVKLYNQGLGQQRIGNQLGIKRGTVAYYLRTNKITDRKGNQRKIKRNPFENIQNSEVQYWLGWLCADGSIHDNRIALALTEKDKDVLENYCKFLGLDFSTVKFKTKKENWDKLGTIRFGHKECAEFLNNIGLTSKKSLTLSLKINITPALLRGIFEGDGYVSDSVNRASIASGSLIFLNQIKEFLSNQKIFPSIHKNGNSFSLYLGGKNCVDFLKLIYSDFTYPKCNRKFLNANKIIQNYEEKN